MLTLKHELIEYTDHNIPVKWIVHDALNSVGVVPPHWHASVEITYVYSGDVTSFTINNIAHPCGAGSIFIVNSAEIHSSIANHCSELKALTIQFPYYFLNQLIPDFEKKKFINLKVQECRESKELRQTLDEFYQTVISTPNELFAIQINRLIYTIVLLLCQSWLVEEGQLANSNIYIRDLGKIQPILSFIQENYDKALSVEVIANQFHLSPNYLSKFFKKTLGMSVLKYLQLVRVSQAQRLLLFTDKQTHIISEEVGFPNEKSFRKAFETVFETNPKKYQIENKR